jgi:hypothetical protein
MGFYLTPAGTLTVPSQPSGLITALSHTPGLPLVPCLTLGGGGWGVCVCVCVCVWWERVAECLPSYSGFPTPCVGELERE